MIGAMWQLYVNAAIFALILIGVSIALLILERWLARRHRTPVYRCTVSGCGRPAEPSDGPFCPYHGWGEVR